MAAKINKNTIPLIGYLVIGMFFVFLSLQMYLVFKHDFTAWKGGGFGMFSAIDDRHLTVRIYTDEGIIYEDFDRVFDDDLRLIRKMPMDKKFDEFSVMVEKTAWYYDPDKNWITDISLNEEAEEVNVVALDISVWEVIYDKRNHVAVPNLMKKRRYNFRSS